MNKPTAKSDDKLTAKEVIMYSAGGLLLLGGGIFLTTRLVKKVKSNIQENRSFEEGTPATFAKGIKMSFENDGWPGTNLTELRNLLRQIPSKDAFEKTASSYQKLYNSNLYRDMADELKSSEYSEMMNIIAAKPQKLINGQPPVYNYQAWAKRLKAAFDKTYGFMPGTDEEAITAVFSEIPSQTAFVEVGKAYAQEYSSNLIEDMKAELEFWEYDDYMKIITDKPQY